MAELWKKYKGTDFKNMQNFSKDWSRKIIVAVPEI